MALHLLLIGETPLFYIHYVFYILMMMYLCVCFFFNYITCIIMVFEHCLYLIILIFPFDQIIN